MSLASYSIGYNVFEYFSILYELKKMDVTNKDFMPLLEYLDGLRSEIYSILINKQMMEECKKTL